MRKRVGKKLTSKYGMVGQKRQAETFTVGKQYPVTVDVNGRKWNLPRRRKLGADLLRFETLVQTQLGLTFMRYKLSPKGICYPMINVIYLPIPMRPGKSKLQNKEVVFK